MDVLTMLREEHHRLERLLGQLEQAAGHEVEEQRALADEVGTALRRHVADEDGLFYPALRRSGRQDPGLLDTAQSEHRRLLLLLDRLDGPAGARPGTPSFRALVASLVGDTRGHLDREDVEVLTAAEEVLDDDELVDLGRRLQLRGRVVAAQEDLAEVTTARPAARRAGRLGGAAAAAAAVLLTVFVARRSRRHARADTLAPRPFGGWAAGRARPGPARSPARHL